MQRIKDGYLDHIQRIVPLAQKHVLEVGSGDGSRTVQIAQSAAKVTAVEPNKEMMTFARTHHQRPNILYLEGVADALPVSDCTHNVVIFTLSFHHVPADRLKMAIEEALRVSTPDGRIIFFEPTFEGSFFLTVPFFFPEYSFFFRFWLIGFCTGRSVPSIKTSLISG